ncbi:MULTISPECIES: tetratricopeptide repeat protein [Streptomyces]|uniref:tetratricopeptide repeat protein n=1 Tax=Streptomyces TaxID=1883 RepID=UPI002248C3F9|nr:tetratricopeptide repeat protein [Streptomyces sp. JHD 1]MCX2968029.1 tetratricopeptide repeat protein [Streptomyces sp. JHD 1]
MTPGGAPPPTAPPTPGGPPDGPPADAPPTDASALPKAVRRLAVALSTATRIEPELLRAMRVTVRPTLDVGVEADLWFGPWSARSGGAYLALRPALLPSLRALLCRELSESGPRDAVRRAGAVVAAAHTRLAPALALEERVTWAALLADAGLADAGGADVDRLLEPALRAALESPERRGGLRRWFTGAWERFPERVRRTPAALELAEVLGGSAYGPLHGAAPPLPDSVPDAVLPVRHDGAVLTVGDAAWPASGILVPDTQPRILDVADNPDRWEAAQRFRVPRGARMSLPVWHVPVYLRTARGAVYRVGPPDGGAVGEPAAQRPEPGPARALLGVRVAELADGDAFGFGVAPPVRPRGAPPAAAAKGGSGTAAAGSGPATGGTDPAADDTGPATGGTGPAVGGPHRRLDTELAPYRPQSVDDALRAEVRAARYASRLVVLHAREPSTGCTRTAWEALRGSLTDWWVWCPPLVDRAEAVHDAVAQDRIGSQTVVWLDDLHLLLDDERAGEDTARSLVELLTDVTRAPVLLLATAEALTRAPRFWAADLLGRATHLGQPTGFGPDRADRHVQRLMAGTPRHKAVVRSGLPRRQPHFAGREAEREALLEALRRADEPHATITGLPGSGKTALAVDVAHAARRRGLFPGGVLYVRPDRAPSPWPGLLTALGVPADRHPAEEGAREELYLSLMLRATGHGRRRVLLLVDEAGRRGQAARGAGPGVAVLATRRRAPATGATVTLGPLAEEAAVAALASALAALRPDDQRIARDAAGARRLAHACGQTPTLLLLAAGALADEPETSPGALAERYERSGTPLRHLRRTLEPVYRGLGAAQARAFRLLSLLPGPDFSVATAAVVLGETPRTTARTLRALATVHLLGPGAAPERWRLHPVERLYADAVGQDHVGEDGRDAALRRLARYLQGRVTQADELLRGRPGEPGAPFASAVEAAAWLAEERVCLVDTVPALLAAGEAEAANRIALALAEFLTERRCFTDLLRVMRPVLAWAEENDDQLTRVAALHNFAVAMARTGDFAAALAALDDAATLHIQQGDDPAYAQMLGNLGATLLVADRAEEAATVLAEADTRLRDVGRHRTVTAVQVLSNLGAALYRLGRREEAVEKLQEAVRTARVTDTGGRERARHEQNLGTVLLETGRTDDALAALDRALTGYRADGDARGEADVRRSVALAHMARSQFAEAAAHLDTAARLYQGLGMEREAAQAFNDHGVALLEAGADEEATVVFEAAQQLHAQSGDPHAAAQSRSNLGNALRRLARWDDVVAVLETAVPQLAEAGDAAAHAQAVHNLGLARLARGEHALAVPLLRESAERHAELGNTAQRAQALYALAKARLSSDDGPAALTALRASVRAFQLVQNRSGLAGALLLLSDVLSTLGREARARQTLREALRARRGHDVDTGAALEDDGEDAGESTGEATGTALEDDGADTGTEAGGHTGAGPAGDRAGPGGQSAPPARGEAGEL